MVKKACKQHKTSSVEAYTATKIKDLIINDIKDNIY